MYDPLITNYSIIAESLMNRAFYISCCINVAVKTNLKGDKSMDFDLRKYNIDRVKKALEGVKGNSVMINDTCLHGVISIDITESEMYDGDPVPEEGYDGGKTELIVLTFNFENGKAVHDFCPDVKHCEISFETDDLWIFQIEDLKQYIERKKFDLDFQLKEYEEYKSK